MQYLRVNPITLQKKINQKINDYNYDCLDILKDHLDINVYKIYLNSLIEYKYKTVWNHIALKWIQLQNKLDEDPEYIKSIYCKQRYNHIHRTITDKELNHLINIFIDNDKFKGIFAINCIQEHFIKV